MKKKYKILPIKHQDTKGWILKKHYAKRMPSISYAFGLYAEDSLVGVCTYGKPASNALCEGVCGKINRNLVYELNRLCVNEGLRKNTLSYFVSQTFKMLPLPLILISYADTSQNHHGYIYQATNWFYTGLSAKRTERYDPNNPNKHSKTVTERMSYKNLSVRNRPQKHRYIMFLGSRRMRKSLFGQLKYKTYPYPKGDNKRYNVDYKPITQMVLFK